MSCRLLLVCLLASGCAMPVGFSQPSRWTTDTSAVPGPLTVQHVVETIEVEDDEIETVATFSTYRAQVAPAFLPRPHGSPYVDIWLRAFLHKTTGRVDYQVYVRIVYRDDWHFYESASYLDAGIATDARLLRIARKVESCAGGPPCLLREDVALAVPEHVLRAAASEDLSADDWRVRLRPQSARPLDVFVPAVEIAGLLQRIDAYPKPGTGTF